MVDELDKEGRSILHYASRMNSTALVDCVMQYASPGGFGPELANANGAFPLHNVARFSSSKAVAEAVLRQSPHIIAVGNNDGALPLHWAAAKNKDLDLVNALIAAHPEAVTTVNHEGYTPLHSAGQNMQLHIVQAIYNAHPPSIALRDTEGGVPLHHASCFNSNLDVVKFLYSAYPEGVTVVQEDGLTPLHLAASQNASVSVMKFLIAVHPAAVTAVDSHGWLPLHCLLNRHRDEMSESRLACLRVLLAANPEAVAAPRNDGVTPLDMARSAEHRDLIVRMMLLAYPAADPPALAALNWASARGRAVETCLLIHRVAGGHPVGAAEPFLYIVRKLCDGNGTAGLSIKNHVLQYILKFL
jgi:ankyrin repeat protein